MSSAPLLAHRRDVFLTPAKPLQNACTCFHQLTPSEPQITRQKNGMNSVCVSAAQPVRRRGSSTLRCMNAVILHLLLSSKKCLIRSCSTTFLPLSSWLTSCAVLSSLSTIMDHAYLTCFWLVSHPSIVVCSLTSTGRDQYRCKQSRNADKTGTDG